MGLRLSCRTPCRSCTGAKEYLLGFDMHRGSRSRKCHMIQDVTFTSVFLEWVRKVTHMRHSDIFG